MKKLKYAAVMLLSGNLAFAGVPATKKELAQSCLKDYLSMMVIENALQLASAPPALIRKNFSVVLERTARAQRRMLHSA